MSDYSDSVLATPGLAGYWPIAGALADASGHGLAAVIKTAGGSAGTVADLGPAGLAAPGLLSPLTDAGGEAVELVNGGGWLEVAHNALLLPASPGFAAECWFLARTFNPTASEYRSPFSKTNTMILRVGPSAPSAPKFQAYYYDATPTALSNGSVIAPALNTAYHFAHRVKDNGDGTFAHELYVNGRRDSVVVRSGANASWSAAANPLRIGSWATSLRTMDGYVQHAAWYNTPLDGARIGHRYRLGAGLERRGIAERRFTFKAGTPAGIDGSVELPFGGALDLSDAYTAGGIVTADNEVALRLRALGIFDEVLA